jgi:hypothetical protein
MPDFHFFAVFPPLTKAKAPNNPLQEVLWPIIATQILIIEEGFYGFEGKL